MYNMMLVDDTDIFRRQFRRLPELKNQNEFAILYEARNGREAINIAKKAHVDIIITDIRMPVMDGIELLKEIKKMNLCGYVILLSEFADFASARQGIIFGAFDFIEKPVDGKKLKALFERLKSNAAEENAEQFTDRRLSEGNSSGNVMIQNICKYIQDNAGSIKLTLESVSEQFFINKSYLSHLFKIETGKNFVDYVTEIKMEKARKMLQDGNLKIYEIAHNLGYENEEYFSRIFKKYAGNSASEYQKIKQGEKYGEG